MSSYHVNNWPEYNRSLINRGSITLWISDDAVRRAARLSFPKLSKKRPKNLVFDSTGWKVYGEGEWKIKVHGKSKRRTWRKFHIAVDPKSHELIIVDLTTNNVADCEVMPKQVKKAPKWIENIYADGAYDATECRQPAKIYGATALIPPPRNAVIHATEDPKLIERNIFILELFGLGGSDDARKLWKKLRGYHHSLTGKKRNNIFFILPNKIKKFKGFCNKILPT